MRHHEDCLAVLDRVGGDLCICSLIRDAEARGREWGRRVSEDRERRERERGYSQGYLAGRIKGRRDALVALTAFVEATT